MDSIFESMKNKIYLAIGHCRQAKAVESLFHSMFKNYLLESTNNIADAQAAIFYDHPIPDHLGIPTVYCPVESTEWLPKILSKEPQTQFFAPKDATWNIENRLLKFNFDLFSFLAATLFRAEEYQSKMFENSRDAQSLGMIVNRFDIYDQPIVDQWIRFIFQHLLGPIPSRFEIQGNPIWMTHDVDHLLRWHWKRVLLFSFQFPLKVFTRQGRIEFKSMLKSVFKGKDPLDQIQTVIDCDQARPSTFFVLGWHRDHQIRRYNILRPRFKKILSVIPKSGREIGLHSSPLHIQSLQGLRSEMNRVKKSLNCPIRMNRSHFLKYDIRQTPKILSQIGIELDSTLGFNDHPGFRCGSAMPFKWFDLNTNQEIEIIIAPLIFADHQMQNELFAQSDTFINTMIHYIRQCQKVGAPCTILMHDLYFADIISKQHKSFYQKILQELDQLNIPWMEAREMIYAQKE